MKRIIIGLDLTEIDESVLAYTAFLATFWQPEQLYVLHVVKSLSESQEEKKIAWNTSLPLDEFLKQKMEVQVNRYFSESLLNKTEFIIGEGEPHEEMLHWAVVKNTDLLIVGRKYSLAGSGMMPQQFALHTPCSVLLVPERVALNLDTVLVSSDFSMYSRKATEVAIELVAEVPYASLYCQYIFEVPHSWITAESYHTAIAKARHEAELAYEKFMATITNQSLPIIPLLAPGNEDEDFTRTYQNAKDIDASLLIVGAKGRGFLTRFFDESFTKKIVETNNKIPLLIVKTTTV